jgi:hypothetical protein
LLGLFGYGGDMQISYSLGDLCIRRQFGGVVADEEKSWLVIGGFFLVTTFFARDNHFFVVE